MYALPSVHSGYIAFRVFISHIPFRPFTSPSNTTCLLKKSILLTPLPFSPTSPSHLTRHARLILLRSSSVSSSFQKSAFWIGQRKQRQIAWKRSSRFTPVGFEAWTSMYQGRRGWIRRMYGNGGSHAKRLRSDAMSLRDISRKLIALGGKRRSYETGGSPKVKRMKR